MYFYHRVAFLSLAMGPHILFHFMKGMLSRTLPGRSASLEPTLPLTSQKHTS